MSTTYAGDATSFPISITLPSDGDGPTIKAADVNVPLEGLADRTAKLKARVDASSGVTSSITYTAAGPTTWTAGANDRRIRLFGWGGGGGGGGGADGSTGANDFAPGGGGGGAPLARAVVLDVTPGTAYEVLCGAAGAAGAANAAGGNGGDTIFRVQGGATLATFKGALGGAGGLNITSSGGGILSLGGTPHTARPASRVSYPSTQPNDSLSFVYGSGYGGEGVISLGGPLMSPRAGADSIEGFSGGAAGGNGATNTYRGGGAGGGGAAGPGGPGLNGKFGGDGQASGTGSAAPISGGGASAGVGCGGGGGGGGGGGPSGGGAASTGLAGGSGQLTLSVIG